MGNALLLFLSTFVTVFAIGFQGLNVVRGHEKAAVLMSFVISGMNLVILKYTPDASLLEMCGYMLGGPVGIVCSMRAHQFFFGSAVSSNNKGEMSRP